MSVLNFDATQVAPDAGFDPIPAGDYVAMIEDSEVKPTKANTGMYLQLVWQIVDGQYKGRKVWDRINIQNQSQTTEEIGQKQLSAVCHAVGVLKVVDSAELHDKPCIIKVTVKPAEGQYLASNEVKGYKALSGSPQVAQAAPVAAPQPAPAAAAAPAQRAATPPWVK